MTQKSNHPMDRFVRRQASTLRKDERGNVLVEYLVVATFAGLLVAIAMLTIGPKAVANYSLQRGHLYLPNP
jgi:Flp pilus assembly pilin Flp